MKIRAFLIPTCLVLAALTPAQGETFLFAAKADAVHVNVFRPLDGQVAHDDTAYEVSMFFGKLDVLVDPNEWAYPEEGGCVDIYHDGVFDAGCGELTVVADGVLGTTTVSGTIESNAFRYDPGSGFEDLGPSQIQVDLVVGGQGLIELSPYTNYAVGVCGLPPQTDGVFVDGRPELQREAGMTGTLVSQVVGSVDPTTLPALLVQASNVAVGACL